MRLTSLIPPPAVTPIEKLTAKFQTFLHLPDSSAFYVLMGAVAANMLQGKPVWLMLIGPPSCGKSQLLNSLLDIPNTTGAASITGEAALLSGTAERDRTKRATGGLLYQIGDTGGLVLNDFTTILSKPDKIPEIMGAFREIHGGRYTRNIGADGGRLLEWTGKLAIYSGCTSEIDQYHSLSAKMGERWINFRIETREGDDYYDEMMMDADANHRTGNWEEALSGYVRQFFQDLDLSYENPRVMREFTATEKEGICKLANITARCRSSVPRDGYSHEVNGKSETEIPVRISHSLFRLLAGMDLIGVPTHIRWRLLTKIAMDSMPKLRRIIVETVFRKPLTVEELTLLLGCSLNTVKRVVKDLELHRVVYRTKGQIALTDWMVSNYSNLLILQKSPVVLTLTCPQCQQSFQAEAIRTTENLYAPPIPAHACQDPKLALESNVKKSTLESNVKKPVDHSALDKTKQDWIA